MTDGESEILNEVFTISTARLFAVWCKMDDLPLTTPASMAHEPMTIQRSPWSFIDNELTWALLFGWVPDVLKPRKGVNDGYLLPEVS